MLVDLRKHYNTEPHHNSSQNENDTNNDSLLEEQLQCLSGARVDSHDKVSIQSDVPTIDSKCKCNIEEIRDLHDKIGTILSI